MRILKSKFAGIDVKNWQNFLIKLGFNVGAPDGLFGPKTVQATKDFQTQHGLAPHGSVGNKTYTKAMGLGLAPLPDVTDAPPSASVTKVRTLPDGVTIYKLTGGEAVFFTTRMHVDADGCPHAYGPGPNGGRGIENNGNARKKDGAFSGDVLVLDGKGDPVVRNGYYVSMTSLRDHAKDEADPAAYVDALEVPYIVLPGGVTGSARVGDVALVIDQMTGARVKAIVADAGPANETGEASIFLAGRLSGLTASQITEDAARDPKSFINPRSGGTEKRRYRYLVFPGTTLKWPQTNAQIEAHVDGALAQLTPEQIIAITTWDDGSAAARKDPGVAARSRPAKVAAAT